ncbi:serine/threonine-protein kinase [Frankia sp. AiPa1]|uniref:serine/threonine-protein kinase n=1 Tax=Frankia sp. AiPa1 TaxID=573492 RepID=UPI00202B2DE5|nr:serine/threonine-protein kinase [Frankia sp. AiPa1]MCL9760910.1 serine/threonine-protein kinase [Frankia sp. AiPa1]
MTIDRTRLAAGLPRYEIGELLGRGAFGAVFAARQRLLDRMVAIKVLDLADYQGNDQAPDARAPHAQGQLDADAHARFAAESRVLASLDHPHVVKVLDGEEFDGLGVLIMELLPRGTVRARARAGGLPLAEICAVGIATAEALGYAHAAGVLHRDVKPANLMFAADDTPKVVDFGIAKIIENVGSAIGTVAGTYPYMGPEIFGFGQPGFATDVYSLGVVLYELLTGRLPFGPRLTFAEYGRHHHSVPPPPMTGVPAPLAELVGRTLHKDAARRPSTRALAVELARAAATQLGPGWLGDCGLPLHVSDDIRDAARGAHRAAQPRRGAWRGARRGTAPTTPAPDTPTPDTPVPSPSASGSSADASPSAVGLGTTPLPSAAPQAAPASGPPSVVTRRWRRPRAGRGTFEGPASPTGPTGTNPSAGSASGPATGAAAGAVTPAGRGGSASGRTGGLAGGTLDHPAGIAAASDGTVYVAQTIRHRVVRVAPDGRISVVAGRDGSGFAGDGGQGRDALLDSPRAVALTPGGDLLIADTFNNRVRRVTLDGIISTVLGGTTPPDGPDLRHPCGLVVDAAGTLYVADTGHHRILRLTPGGSVEHHGGTGIPGLSGDGGPATRAEINAPHGLALDRSGRLYLADTGNGRIRRVDADGTISTIAGTFPGRRQRMPDPAPALAAVLHRPQEIALAADGSCFVLDIAEQQIYRITPDLRLLRVDLPAGPGDARGIALAPDGVLLVADAAGRGLLRLG